MQNKKESWNMLRQVKMQYSPGLKLFELEVVWLESAIAVNWSAVLTPLY